MSSLHKALQPLNVHYVKNVEGDHFLAILSIALKISFADELPVLVALWCAGTHQVHGCRHAAHPWKEECLQGR